MIQIFSDIGQSAESGFQVRQVRHEIRLGVFYQLDTGVTKHTQFVECSGDSWSFPVQHVQCRWSLLQDSVDGVALRSERTTEPIEGMERCHDVRPLRIDNGDKLIEAAQEVAYIILTPGQRGVEAVDDVADLTETTAVDHR
ncbi:hypothetical protein A5761_09860 [Mycolicibacterium setense]|nr:hypothetical protein A5761_09860 [Mycolicibacterium setense]